MKKDDDEDSFFDVLLDRLLILAFIMLMIFGINVIISLSDIFDFKYLFLEIK